MKDEKIIDEINALQINNPIDWWDLFAMVTRTVTMKYSKDKAKIKRSLKHSIQNQMTQLESIDNESITLDQKHDYTYLQHKYSEIIEYEIKGHQIRTRGQPSFEFNEPNI